MPAPPRHHTPRSNRETRGHQLAVLAKAKGQPLMPWQRDAADVALEVDPATGLPWYGIVVISVQRQAGKTKLEGDLADWRCLTKPRARTWYTAQTGKDASAWMRDEHMAQLAAAPVFGRPGTPGCHYRASRRAGQEGIEWKANGSTFRVFAPLRDALHGKQSDLVVIDEAWSLTPGQGADVRQAVRPTMNTRPGAQLYVVSTRGDDASSFLDEYIDLGIASLGISSTRVAFIDYGIPDDADADDLDVIAAHHPAYGYTLSRDALVAAQADFANDPAGWARAYGNRATRTRTAAIAPITWAAAARPRPELPARYSLGIDATPAGDQVAISAAWTDGDGAAWVEILHAGPVDRDTPALVAALQRQAGVPLVADRAAIGVLALLDEAAAAGLADVTFLATADAAAACAGIERGLIAGTLHHSNDSALDAAVEVATKRQLGDGGFAWGRKTSAGNIAPLNAASFALRGWSQLPAPRRKPVAALT